MCVVVIDNLALLWEHFSVCPSASLSVRFRARLTGRLRDYSTQIIIVMAHYFMIHRIDPIASMGGYRVLLYFGCGSIAQAAPAVSTNLLYQIKQHWRILVAYPHEEDRPRSSRKWSPMDWSALNCHLFPYSLLSADSIGLWPEYDLD